MNYKGYLVYDDDDFVEKYNQKKEIKETHQTN